MLSLDGVTSLSHDAALRLATFKGSLSLDGLESLTVATAGTLATFGCDHLLLGGATSLPADAAAALAGVPGGILALDGLTRFRRTPWQPLAGSRAGPSASGAS